MLEARKYRLCLSPAQQGLAGRTAGCCRALWNAALEQRRQAYAMGLAKPWSSAQSKELPELKQAAGLEWLAEAPAQCLQQTLHDLDQAYVNFFNGLAAFARGERPEPPGPPTWKRKGRSRDSFRFPQGRDIEVRRLNRRWAEVKLPKLGWCRFRWTRAVDGQIKHATITHDTLGWHVSLCVQTGRETAWPNGGPPVGLDRGVTVSVADSDGGLHHVPGLSPSQRLRRLRRRAGRQETARRHRPNNQRQRSRRHQRTLDQKARLEAREARVRTDFIHKLTSGLTKSHGLIVTEQLAVQAMTASAKGTVERPGVNVAQKRGLNRAILRSGWGELRRQLDYKAGWYGSRHEQVAAAYSSQECAECTHVMADNRPTRDTFRCVACGHQDHADVNAARVILARAVNGYEGRPQGLRSQRAEPSCEEARLRSANLPTARAA